MHESKFASCCMCQYFMVYQLPCPMYFIKAKFPIVLIEIFGMQVIELVYVYHMQPAYIFKSLYNVFRYVPLV